MKKYLSISFTVFLFLFLLLGSFLPILSSILQKHQINVVSPVYAAPPTTAPTIPVPSGGVNPDEGTWVTDSETTFAGKNANRSKDLVNWVLENYRWSYDDHTLVDFWSRIRNIVFMFIVLMILITAFTMIITGGQSITAIQFFRKFIIVIFLVTFSYAFIRILYQIIDIIQSFFIRNPDNQIISTKDLLNISFDYVGFQGWRLFGYKYDESAFISLLLTKITAITYFVMAGILIVRKVILWFFITVSPIYPILFFYYPIRNTAKIWIGEFFRWLLYAPLFTIFLSGLVVLWRQNIGLLPFTYVPGKIVYPTAINILLGGPGQVLGFTNSINYTDTFALYVIALIMLWICIFLPFVLLRIFLDYLSNLSINKDNALNYVNNALNYFTNKEPLSVNKTTAPGPKTPPPFPTGVALPIPYTRGSTGAARPIPQEKTIGQGATIGQYKPTYYQTATLKPQVASMEALRMTNLAVPTLRDIARYETTQITTNNREVITKTHEILEKIANPASVKSSSERLQFSEIRQKLVQEKLKGSPIATNILNAADNLSKVNRTSLTNISQASQQNNQQAVTQLHQTMNQTLQKLSNPSTVTTTKEKLEYSSLREKLQTERIKGNPVAVSLLSLADKFTQVDQQGKQQVTKEFQETLQKINNPAIAKTSVEQEHIKQINKILTEEQAKGNQVASSILKTAHALSAGSGIPEGANIPTVNLPAINQVQTVSLDDYESVKKMWQDNYHKLEIPKTLDKPNRTREEWIKDDLTDVNRAIDLLISKDQQKVKEGMGIVSHILPFLLIGGFSQTEVIAYLKAKQEAGKTILNKLKEEKEKVEEETTTFITSKKTTQNVQRMHMSAESENISSSETLSDDDEDKSMLENLSAPALNPKQTIQNIQNVYHISLKIDPASLETIQRAKLNIPSISQIATYEITHTNSSSLVDNDVTKIQEILKSIANPDAIVDQTRRQQFSEIKKKLIEEKAKNNPVAISILSAAETTIHPDKEQVVNQFQQILQQLNHPSLPTAEENQQYTEIKEKLTEESKKGNNFATLILTMITNNIQQTYQILEKLADPAKSSSPTEKDEITKVREILLQASRNRNKVAEAMISIAANANAKPNAQEAVKSIVLPQENQIQTVNLEDYESVKKLWQDNYQKNDVPQTLDKPNRTRKTWLEDDIAQITEAIDLLISNDPEKVKKGMAIVSQILPFLLIGGFSKTEVVAYLKAKLEAAKSVVVLLDQQDKAEVDMFAPIEPQQTEKPKEMHEEITPDKKDDEK